MHSYFFDGDGVNDTAAHAGPTYSERRGLETCWHGMTPPLQTCLDDIDGVDAGYDPVDNYMNYLPGFCFEKFGRFTPGQVERMVAEYETYRYTGTCRLNECRAQNDCDCGSDSDGENDTDSSSLRSIRKAKSDKSFCLPCLGHMRRCESSSDGCSGAVCVASSYGGRCIPFDNRS